MTGDNFNLDGKNLYITRSGYTGEDGFEISIPNNKVEKLIKFLIENKVNPIGLGARDTLRLEAGLCLYGHDLNEKTNPIEANLKWAIAKRRREEGGFNGWEKIKELIANGSDRKRVGILPEGKIIARENTKVFSDQGEEIGLITSGTFGPSVNAPVAMGYLNSKFAVIGTKIQLEVRGKKYGGKVSELPFFKKSYVK
jgi:aminomethyltransferase